MVCGKLHVNMTQEKHYETAIYSSYYLFLSVIPNSFCFLVLIQSEDIPRLMPVTKAEIGENVTLHCANFPAERDGILWHKQTSGYIPQIIAAKVYETIRIHSPFHLRFTAAKADSDFTLTIRNVTKGDEANYFCQQEYSKDWTYGTFLSVKGKMSTFHFIPFC